MRKLERLKRYGISNCRVCMRIVHAEKYVRQYAILIYTSKGNAHLVQVFVLRAFIYLGKDDLYNILVPIHLNIENLKS